MSRKTVALNDKRTINGWAFFDWANSAYFLVIATAIFPPYFEAITGDTIPIFGGHLEDSVFYSYAVSFAFIVIAILSPLLSGIADFGGRRKFFLKLFTIIGSAACVAMFFFGKGENVWFGIITFIIAAIGANGGIVFYNAYLPEIASEDMYDKVSAKGYAYGYIGSVLLLILCLLFIQFPHWFGMEAGTLQSRIAFLLVGIWWIGFAQITFNRLPDDVPVKAKGLVRKGLDELLMVWRKVKKQKNIMRFLLSFFFYMAGVQTVIYLATIFASEELDFAQGELILTVLILQVVAIGGAYLFAAVSKIRGNKFSLIFMIVIWILICIGAYFVQQKIQFFVLAGFVGMVLGGIQSLSRSTYSKLIEERSEDLTSYFSFYDVLSKMALVSGAFLFGFVQQVTGGMRNSVLALGILFVVGIVILARVDMRHLAR